MKRVLPVLFVLVLLPGCRSIHPSVKASFGYIAEAERKLLAGDYDGAARAARKNLEQLTLPTGASDQDRHEIYVERGLSWYFIGSAKLLTTVPTDENRKYVLRDVYPLLGKPEGGYEEFQKALSELNQAVDIPNEYVTPRMLANWMALAQMYSGDFEDAEETFQIAMDWSAGNNLSPSRRIYLFWNRIRCIRMHVYYMWEKGDRQKERLQQLTLLAEGDVAVARKLAKSEQERSYTEDLAGNVKELRELFE